MISSAVDWCSSSSDSDSSDDCKERKDLEIENIWSAIQKDKNKESEKAGAFDIWSSIVSQKTNEDASKSSSSLPPPYVHPLVKRSQSSLSEKSLEICTENLGSETGSDGLSSYHHLKQEKQRKKRMKKKKKQRKNQSKNIKKQRRISLCQNSTTLQLPRKQVLALSLLPFPLFLVTNLLFT